jgi:hypothetical protein
VLRKSLARSRLPTGKAETMILQIEKFDRAAVVQKEKRIKCLVDDLGLSRDDAIRSVGKLPDIRMDEDYDDLDIGTLLQSDEED